MKFRWLKKVKKNDDVLILNSLRLQLLSIEKAKTFNEITNDEYDAILKNINDQLKEMENKYGLG